LSHWRQIRTNNPLERIIREIRRRTRVVGAFPDGHSALMLSAPRLRSARRVDAGGRVRGMSHKSLATSICGGPEVAGAVRSRRLEPLRRSDFSAQRKNPELLPLNAAGRACPRPFPICVPRWGDPQTQVGGRSPQCVGSSGSYRRWLRRIPANPRGLQRARKWIWRAGAGFCAVTGNYTAYLPAFPCRDGTSAVGIGFPIRTWAYP
jgi:hypothetical protein